MEAQPLKLRITKGPRAGEALEFRPSCRIRVGRVVRGNNVAIKDAGISSKHLSIDFDLGSGKWVLRDLESSNGTLLNDDSVLPEKPYSLTDGDVVKIGESTSISVELSSAVVDSKRNPSRRAASRVDIEGDGAGTVSTISGRNDSKAEGRVLKCEVVDLDPEVGLGNAGALKEGVGPVRASTRRTRGRRKEAEKDLGFGSVSGRASEDRYVPEFGEKKAVEGRRTRTAMRSMKNLDEPKQVGDLENDCVVKEKCDSEKGIEEVKVANLQEENETRKFKERELGSQDKRNESKRTRAGSRRRKKLDEEKQMGVMEDAEILHTIQEAPNEGKEDKENAQVLSSREDDGIVKDKSNVGGILKGTESNSGEGHPNVVDNRGSHVEMGSKNVSGVNDNSREDCSLPDLTKITLREWFDLMEVHLPKQIIFETEKMIAEMRTKALRVREYVAEQKNNKCKEHVQ